MPAAKPIQKRAVAAKSQPPKRPAKPYPGYLTDEWFRYALAMMERETPAKIKKDLIEFGILDKEGNYST